MHVENNKFSSTMMVAASLITEDGMMGHSNINVVKFSCFMFR